MIARDPFYVEPPTIAPGMTIADYRRGRPARRPTIRHRIARRVRIGGRHA